MIYIYTHWKRERAEAFDWFFSFFDSFFFFPVQSLFLFCCCWWRVRDLCFSIFPKDFKRITRIHCVHGKINPTKKKTWKKYYEVKNTQRIQFFFCCRWKQTLIFFYCAGGFFFLFVWCEQLFWIFGNFRLFFLLKNPVAEKRSLKCLKKTIQEHWFLCYYFCCCRENKRCRYYIMKF